MKWKVEIMEQWIIYKHPRDYPNKYVVRRFWIDSGEITPDLEMPADTLEEARNLVPPGLHCLPRFEDDQPQIVEVWL